MSRKILLSVVILLVTVVAWGCGTSDDDEKKNQTQPTNDAGDSDVQLEDVQDGSVIDGNLSEADLQDTYLPDDGTLDSTPSDSDVQDSDVPDGNEPDADDADAQNQDAPDDSTTDSGTAVICPSCDELLTWDTTSFDNSTYGEIGTVNDWGDAYAYKMLDECPGWSIFEGHAGGTGDTLQISSCDDGVVLIWAYEWFTSIHVSQGWTGTTSTQIAIGSSYQDFVQAYPDYDSTSTELTAYGYAHLKYVSGFATFQDSVLSALYVY